MRQAHGSGSKPGLHSRVALALAVMALAASGASAQATGSLPDGQIGVIVVTRTGTAALVDLRTASVVWTFEGLGYASAVTPLDEETLLVAGPYSVRIVQRDGTVISELRSDDFRMITSGQLLDNGHLLLSDGEAKWVREYSWDGTVHWSAGPFHFPSDARRLPDGNTLIADGTSSVVLLNPDSELVWYGSLQSWAQSVARLENGMTLVGGSRIVQLLDEDGHSVWTEPFDGRMGSVAQWETGELFVVDTDSSLLVGMSLNGERLWEFDVSQVLDAGRGLLTATRWPYGW
jgi:outer membrane protein assembly factor BamB